MTEATVFVVMGSIGEYSDRNVYSVKAFYDEQEARDFIPKREAQDVVKYIVECKRRAWVDEQMNRWRAQNPEPVNNAPEKPRFNHVRYNSSCPEGQRIHLKAIEAWREASAPFIHEFREAHNAWSAAYGVERRRLTAASKDEITEENYIPVADIGYWEKPSYYIEEIPIR